MLFALYVKLSNPLKFQFLMHQVLGVPHIHSFSIESFYESETSLDPILHRMRLPQLAKGSRVSNTSVVHVVASGENNVLVMVIKVI